MSTIQVLAGDWGRHASAMLLKGGSRILRLRAPLGVSEDIDLFACLARAEELRDRKDYERLGWSIDLVRRAPLRLTKRQGLICLASRLREGRSLLAATDRETCALIESAAMGQPPKAHIGPLDGHNRLDPEGSLRCEEES